jgi:hypothetical protein
MARRGHHHQRRRTAKIETHAKRGAPRANQPHLAQHDLTYEPLEQLLIDLDRDNPNSREVRKRFLGINWNE